MSSETRLTLTARSRGGDQELTVLSLRGGERVSALYEYELEACAPRDAEGRIRSLLGEDLTVEIAVEGQEPRTIGGIISSVRVSLHDRTFEAAGGMSEEHVLYGLTLSPNVYPLSRNRRCRLFQATNLAGIVGECLRGFDSTIDFEEGSYPYHLAVQYDESDWSHLERRLTEEGAYYYFLSKGDRVTVCLADSSPKAPLATSLSERGQPGVPRLLRWKERQRLVPYKCGIVDRDSERFSLDVDAEAEFRSVIQGGTRPVRLDVPCMNEASVGTAEFLSQRFTRFGFSGALGEAAEDDLDAEARRRVDVRLQQRTAQGFLARGRTDCATLRPGHAVEIRDADGRVGRYFVTSIKQRVEAAAPLAGLRHRASVYRCDFECLPIDLPYRAPTREPVPFVPGVETATVVGMPQHDVTNNEHGSVLVRFHWDERPEGMSSWIRVLQPSAGTQFGHAWLPRQGDEVVVAFEDGDPDRPLVVASLYNDGRMPAGDRRRHRDHSSIAVRSQGGTSESVSHWLIDDASMEGTSYLAAIRDMAWTSRNDCLLETGNDCSIVVGDLSGISREPNQTGAVTEGDDGAPQYSVDVSGSFDKDVLGPLRSYISGYFTLRVDGMTEWIGYGPVVLTNSSLTVAGASWTQIDVLSTRVCLPLGSLQIVCGISSIQYLQVAAMIRSTHGGPRFTHAYVDMLVHVIEFENGIVRCNINGRFEFDVTEDCSNTIGQQRQRVAVATQEASTCNLVFGSSVHE
ncbi:Phage-related baseplate assembly protein [Planctomycetes bacterium Pan216]|uniref:Phage-related baseplate assembly protein n=1 Tax=Kolteria novifilia TaxID=2527975 RepID=A0A518AZK4_9BACT|nr:Phage-related baseplate assembly protein [Planctomycetes bacterium Pan216]